MNSLCAIAYNSYVFAARGRKVRSLGVFRVHLGAAQHCFLLQLRISELAIANFGLERKDGRERSRGCIDDLRWLTT